MTITLTRPFQRDLEQLTDQLHGEVLEGQRRAVEQFQQVMAGGKLAQGRLRNMAEIRVNGFSAVFSSASVKLSPRKGLMTRKAASP